MKRYLSGIHDREGSHIVPPGGWVLDVVSIAARQPATDYTALGDGLNWIVRLNWDYGSTGTLPLPAGYSDFAQQCAAYVQGSRGCTRWIIGNEPNHSQEWPAGQVITPVQYADCFQKCRAAIKRVQPEAEVIPAPVAPWNVEAGDWIAYQRNVWDRVEADALAVHSYIHEADPNLVNSDQTMDPPFEDRLFQFNAYRDLLFAVPDKFRHLPVYMTEANPLDGWQARGIIPAMLDNVNWWNEQPNVQQIQCVIFYRYPDYDKWGMESKGDVIAEFKRHATRHWSPEPRRAVVPTPPPVADPPKPSSPENGNKPNPAYPPLSWDSRLDQRGAKLVRAEVGAGREVYRLVRAEWRDREQSQGRHHIFVEVLDRNGSRLPGVAVKKFWPDGSEIKHSETKANHDHALDFPMWSVAPSYGVEIEGRPSDVVTGLGMGSIEQPHHTIHTSYHLTFQATLEQSAPVNPTPPVVPRPQPEPPAQGPSRFVHPVKDPNLRGVSQGWGARPEVYRQFVYEGVPLRGHNGIDFRTPVGSVIVAVDAGKVVEAAGNPTGWGDYIKIVHTWGESLYAHLSRFVVNVGDSVRAGQNIANSGNTGFSTGPHLHFGIRIYPYSRADGWGGFSDPTPYLPGLSTGPVDPGDNPLERYEPAAGALIKASANGGVDPLLLASLAWAESSWRPGVISSAGATGLLQIMPNTWAEWSPRVNATNPKDAYHNAAVGAAYFAYLIQEVGSLRRALWAYNWGPGRVLAGGTPPAETIEFASKVLHGYELLKAVQKTKYLDRIE